MFVPAFDNFTTSDGGGSGTMIQTAPLGRARRSTIIQVAENANQKYPLVGIIEGPPPVPNENLVELLPTQLDTALSTMTYGSKVTAETETSLKGSAGPVVKIEGAAGTPLGHADFSIEASVLFGGGTTDKSATSTLTTTQVAAKAIKPTDTAAPQVRAQGMALLWQLGFSGYNYQLVDSSGVPFPGTTTFLQLQPFAPHIVAYPFVFDPGA